MLTLLYWHAFKQKAVGTSLFRYRLPWIHAYDAAVRIVWLWLALLLPVTTQAQLPTADTQANVRLQQDFSKFNKHYRQLKPTVVARIHELAARMYAAEGKGIRNSCGHQILFEAEELAITSAHLDQVDRRLDQLEEAIRHPSPDRQDAEGLWGDCTEQWYLKLYDTYDRLEAAGVDDKQAQLPLPGFLSRVATPEKLRAYLDQLAVSDVARTGVDQGLEFNQTISILLRMIALGEPQNYRVDPKLRLALLDRLFNTYRNVQTGYWGEQYRHCGHVEFQDDLSTTFHIVSYLKGQVPAMDQVVATTLAVRDLDYPVGWLWNGEFWNHNNMDVVTLFRYGWPTATPSQQRAMHATIERMLSWCLVNSLQPDGSFRVNIADGSVEDAAYYGTAFLARIGYFNPQLRFWTNESFADAPKVKARIAAFVRKHQDSDSLGDHYKRVALELSR